MRDSTRPPNNGKSRPAKPALYLGMLQEARTNGESTRVIGRREFHIRYQASSDRYRHYADTRNAIDNVQVGWRQFVYAMQAVL